MTITQNGALKKDDNDNPVMGGTSSVDNATIINAAFDPITRRLLMDSAGGGTGTVTSVSVVSANGLAGSVATATTTPAITLSTTITGILKGNGTAISAGVASDVDSILPTQATHSGQFLTTDGSVSSWATVSGSGTVNSGTAGQIAYYASSTNAVSGNANITISSSAITLGVAGSAVGTLKFANATSGTITLSPSAGALGTSTLTLPIATDTLVGKATTDTLTNKTIAGAAISGALTGTGAYIPVTLLNSGTSASSSTFWRGDGTWATPAGSGGLTVGTTTITSGTNGRVLYDNSGILGELVVTPTPTASTIAEWDANVNLSANSFIQGYTTTATAGGTTTLTVASTGFQLFTGSLAQTVVMPVASTLVLGQQYFIKNQSNAGNVTVNSSGGNAIVVLAPQTSAILTCVLTSGTTAASWDLTYPGITATSGKKLVVANSITLAGSDGTTMTFPVSNATIARTDSGQTFTGVNNFTSPDTTTSITTSSVSFTAWAGATTLLTIGGTGASASMFAPSTLDATSSITGAIRTSGGISAAKALNVGTTITGGGNFTIGTSNSATVGTIELGAATDTTIARVSAGVISVEGVTIPSVSSTNTLTNKRVSRRVVTTTQSATPTINTDNTDVASITALGQAITSMTTNLSGTPVAGDFLEIQITDNGTARAITWGTSFVASTVALPTTTVISTLLHVLFEWDTASSKWICVAVA